ncbi:MAG: S8 family serine peptidase [Flavobacteriales bacterium]|jgi:serine protease|nr:S8 family serine peptidase [Flavobacteriales bacterium]MBK7752642.1 S8 family serine peptidase [Flavobacteriales bacterium]MBK9076688.1 S8 family serine peptidase [Flavobacteriales bacterium]MBK9538103.1 S8 family serine peptidase [Flavobacteriales bacterium]
MRMKNLLRSLPLLALALFTAESRAQEAAYLPGDVLVMLQPGRSAEALVKDLALVDGLPTQLRVVKEVSAPMRTWLLHTDQTALPQRALLHAVQRHPATQMAQNNHVISERIVPNDPTFGSQWHHVNPNDADIDSDLAWDITTGGLTATGDTIVVCIIENSDLPHPDLIGNAWFNHLEIPNDGIDNDANGYTDDFQGWNPQGNDDDVYGGGHGTQVAGMIGAKGDNGIAVAGANWNVKMMVVTRDGIGEAEVVESYTYPWMMRRLYNQTGGSKGAFVVATNASWGIDFGDPADAPLWCAVYDSLGAEGVLNCGATANQAIDIDVEGDLPTACPSPFMVSVTATNNMDMRTFSAYGATTIDVGAPGADVVTTSIGGGTGSTSGTSFASPLTAGVIGLLYSAPCSNLMSLVYNDPAAGALYVRDKLFEGVEQVGNLPGNTLTGGRINSNNSLMAIMAACGPCPSPFDLNATNTGIGEVLFSWTASGGTPFTLEYRPVGDSTWTTQGGLINSSFAASGLLPCTDYEFQVSVQCDSITSDPSGLFNWTTEGCCAAPDNFMPGFIGSNIANVTWSPVLAATSYEVQVSVSGTGNWTSFPGITNTFLEITPLDSCTDYDVQVRTLCNGVPTDWSSTILVHTTGCGACLDNVYCASVSDDASEEWIANVTVGTLNNTTISDDGYGDYTSEGTDLIIGDSTAISLSPGFAGTLFEEGFTVWIDWDHDADFTTTGELVFAAPLSDATVTGNLFVPLDALPGNARMRVIMVYNDNAASGCEDAYEFGETEDYCVNLVNPNTGMSETIAGPSLTHFPDPADRVVFFDLHGANGTVLIELLDNSGRTVERGSTANGRLTLTTAWLPDGLYFFRATQQDRELARGKVMVAH